MVIQDLLIRECRDGARLGYTGKQIVHPKQVAAAHAHFAPQPDRVQWAQAVVKAFNEAAGTHRDDCAVCEGVDMHTHVRFPSVLDITERLLLLVHTAAGTGAFQLGGQMIDMVRASLYHIHSIRVEPNIYAVLSSLQLSCSSPLII